MFMNMNMKGGVGKTTLALTFSYEMAQAYGQRILLIDYDPQANASYAALGPDKYFDAVEEGRSVATVLRPELQDDDLFEVITGQPQSAVSIDGVVSKFREFGNGGRLDIVASSIELVQIALNKMPDETENVIQSRWEGLIAAARSEYDCVVVDCHPSGSFFTKTSLLVATAVIVPVTSDGFAAAGLGLMRDFIERWRRPGRRTDYVVVFNDINNRWDDDGESRIRALPRVGPRCLPSKIEHSMHLARLVEKGPVQEQSGRWVPGVLVNVTRVTGQLVNMLKRRRVLGKGWVAL